MGDVESIKTFLNEKIVPSFDRALADAERRLAAAQREVEDLRAGRGTVAWEIDGVGTFYVNIEEGRLQIADAPADAPFMAIFMSGDDWRRIAEGRVHPGMLGQGNQRPMGRARIERMRALRGTLAFVVTELPDGDLRTILHFGSEPRPAEPQTVIRIPGAVAEKIQKGELNPQAAFMQGQMRMEGDAALAMQVGMAMAM